MLDNCEHVVPGAASLVTRLIEHPNVNVLATSRSPLAAPGEYVVALGPLRVPADNDDEANPAFELFLDRASTAGASWLEVPEQRAAAAEIVRRLDGLPLAIELAAARSRAMPTTAVIIIAAANPTEPVRATAVDPTAQKPAATR